MKTFIIAVVVVAGLVGIGWMTFANSDEQASISIDKQEVQRDTAEAVETTKKALNKAEEETKELLDESGDALNEVKEETKEAVEDFNDSEDSEQSDDKAKEKAVTPSDS